MNHNWKATLLALLAGGGLLAAAVLAPSALAVVAGERVNGKDAPWAVSLQVRVGSSWRHACSATVIGPRRVLTARHCAEHLDTWQWTAVAGNGDPTARGARRVAVTRVWVPILLDLDRAGASLAESDVAVGETDRDLGVPALPLTAPGTPLAGEEPVWAYGFGLTSRDWSKPAGPALLRRAAMRLYTPAQCAESDFGDEPTGLCAHRAEGPGGGTLSNGDSGGGVTRQGANGPELVGVNSTASTAGLIDSASGFASVPALHAFITAPERGFELPRPRGRARVSGRVRVGARIRCAASWTRPVRRVEVRWQLTRAGAARGRVLSTGARPWKVPRTAAGLRLSCAVIGGLSENYGSRTEWSSPIEVKR